MPSSPTRRRPNRPSRRQWLRYLVAAGVGVPTGVGVYGYTYERRRLQLVEAALPVSGLPERLAGLRVGLITDLHHSATVSIAQVADAAGRLMRERPDLIVLGGDYVSWHDRRFMRPAAEALAGLGAPHGVYAVLGNHDDDREMPAALAAQGFAVLKDARTRIMVRGEALDLIGLRFWTRRVQDIIVLARGAAGTSVLLAHDPRRVAEAAMLNIPLVLSGHTHGGQIVLPGIGAVAARRFPTAAGLLRKENATLFVSRGVGTIYVPMRLNCPPEVAVLTLQPVRPR